MYKRIVFSEITKSLIVFAIFVVLFNKNLIAQNNISSKVKNDISLSKQALDRGDTIISFIKADEALQFAKKESEFSKAVAQLQMAKVEYARAKYADSYKYYWNSYAVFKRKKSFDYSIEALYGMGSLFEKFEVWTKAIYYLQYADSLLNYTTSIGYRIPINKSLASCYFKNEDYSNALFYYKTLKKFAIQYKDLNNEIIANKQIALSYAAINELDKAISVELSLVDKYNLLHDTKSLAKNYYQIGKWYQNLGDYSKAISFYDLSQSKINKNDSLHQLVEYRKAELYSDSKDYSKSTAILKKLMKEKHFYNNNFWRVKILNLWVLNAYYKGEYTEAIKRDDSLVNILDKVSDYDLKIMILKTLAVTYEQNEDKELSLQYYKRLDKVRIHKNSTDKNQKDSKFNLYQNLSLRENQFQISNLESELSNMEIDKLRIQKEKNIQQIKLLQEQQRRKQLIQQNKILEKEKENEALLTKNKILEAKKKQDEAERIIRENKLKEQLNEARIKQLQNEAAIANEKNRRLTQNRIYLAALILIGIIVFILILKAYLKNKKLNQILEEQNAQLEKRTKQTEEALQKVKETQSQLIESERLASLGQLTAGIAHEIRNPLNFVNNFSSLIIELFDELDDVLDQLQIPEGELKDDLLDILNLIKANNLKVNKHGVRASEIISRMLDASRGGAHDPEDTDINQLVVDSAKLAYQGVRGELTSFNLDLRFEIDKEIGIQKVIHQDLGRVIINITNNACHAMEEKILTDSDYIPVLTIRTKNRASSFIIEIEDNGKGMSEELQSKIFDPFFTTKAAGKGTGLGLTMTYDIIRKMHKGDIKVESKVNEFTRFTIEIPKLIK